MLWQRRTHRKRAIANNPDKLRLGVVGVGSVVREIYQHLYFASAYTPDIAVEAVADPDPDTLRAFGDAHDIPEARRFNDHHDMLAQVELDAVHCNTPDHLHEAPTIAALEAGLDVLVPKPLADTVDSAHRMLAAARENKRLLLVDFHKRCDPRIREAATRYQAGRYGSFQSAYWSMLDRLLVADPNHTPRFFASADFAAANTPISFLTVHMVDALMWIIRERPVRVRAHAWRQKLPALQPIAVDGYDLCDTEVRFENGGVAHILTGWHLPNTARATTVHQTRTVCTDGMFDALAGEGFEELTADGIRTPGALAKQFHADGTVTGYVIDYPGACLRTLRRYRDGALTAAQYEQHMSPAASGFWATAVVEAAHRSLNEGERTKNGACIGVDVDLTELLRARLNEAAAQYLQTTLI